MNDVASSPAAGNPVAPVEYALWLAALGIAVFPLNPADKRPYSNRDVAAAINRPEPPQGEGGLKLATADSAAINAWWSRWPGAMIGIRTGTASGIIVMDVDHKGGKDGFATIKANGWTIPATVAVQTPSGGAHYYFRISRDGARRWKTDAGTLGVGLDRRGDDGYVAWYGADLSQPMSEPPAWMIGNSGVTTGPRDERKPLGTDSAPTFADASKALHSIDNPDNYDEWRDITCAYRQAATGLGVDDATIRQTWEGWCAQFHKNNAADNDKLWRSLDNGTALGWTFLRGKAAPHVQAELIFGNREPVQGEIITKDMYDEPLFGKLAGSTVSTELVAHIKDAGVPIAFDLFKHRQVKFDAMPWEKRTNSKPTPWTDEDDIYLQSWFHHYQLKPTMENIKYAVTIAARRSEYNSITDYITSLQWDGLKRIDHLFIRYFNAANREFATIVGAKFLIGMVARAYRPGCKRDEVIVLEGEQGILKSTALNILAGDDYFSDSLPNLHDKDAAQHLQGLWLVEIAELAAMRRSEIEDAKRFIATRIDKFRPAYGRHVIESPRTAIFAATTNDDAYLKDTTGARRFWPIKCGVIDTDGLQRDRDQLFAEAAARYRFGERYWLDGDERAVAAAETAERHEADPWHDAVARYCATVGAWPVTMEGIVKQALGLPYDRQNAATTKRIAGILRTLGYKMQRSAAQRTYVKIM